MEARWNGENSNIIMTGETFFFCIWCYNYAYNCCVFRVWGGGGGGGGVQGF